MSGRRPQRAGKAPPKGARVVAPRGAPVRGRTAAEPGSRPGSADRGAGRRPAGRRGPAADAVLADPGAQVHRVGAETGTDLAHFLAMSIPGGLPIREIRRLLADGRCRIDGRVETFGSRKVRRGEIISFLAPRREERRPRFVFAARRLLLDRDDLVAYDKPPGLPVTPTDSGNGPSLIGVLRRELGDLLPVHRLDADTSGIVVLARSRSRQAQLEAAFREHAVAKRYRALVRGTPRPTGEHISYLVCVEQGQGYERWTSGRGRGAMQAHTAWRVERQLGSRAALVRISPLTGRTHQIRVHFSELGHPLIGDRIYGDRRDPIFVPRHLLHADGLAVVLSDGLRLDLHAALPRDFSAAIADLIAH